MSLAQMQHRGRIHLSEYFLDSGKFPKMIYDLQATVLSMEFDYRAMHFQMLVSSPILPDSLDGSYVTTYVAEYNNTTDLFEFVL